MRFSFERIATMPADAMESSEFYSVILHLFTLPKQNKTNPEYCRAEDKAQNGVFA